MPRFWLIAVACLACLALGGCAQTATVHYWQPAELDAPHIQRIAVAEFDGEHAAEIAAALTARLGRNIKTAAPPPEDAVQQTGAERDSDDSHPRFEVCSPGAAEAVIVGSVLTRRAYDKEPEQPQLSVTLSSDPDVPPPPPISATDLRVRAAEVRLELRLIDTCGGDVLVERTFKRSREWGVTSHSRSPDDDEVLAELTDECLDEFMALLLPQRAYEDIRLAAGEWYRPQDLNVLKGVRLARRGRWREAELCWREVTEQAPENDAALFNLGVALAQRGDYAAAEEFAMRALRVRHTECYAQGLDQLRRYRSGAERIERQSPRRIMTAAHPHAGAR